MGDVDRKEEKNVEENKTEKAKLAGNILLVIFLALIIGTGSLIYYMLHAEKEIIDKQYNEITEQSIEKDDNPESIANIIDSAIADVTNSSTINSNEENENRKIMNEKLIVLYNGLLLDISKMEEIPLKYIDAHSDEKDKYVITYSNYENYSYKDMKLGTLSEQMYDGLQKIENVGKVAISEDYNAIPRNIKVVNTVPTIVLDNNSQMSQFDTVKTLIVDLDGNSTNEYILLLANKTTGYSKITLVDAKGTKIADLASIEKSKWSNKTNTEYYLSLNNVEIIDVDNDGIMEILVEIPHPTGNSTISLLKYKNGTLQGKTGIECSLVAE